MIFSNYSTYAVHFAVVEWVVSDLPRFRFFTFKDLLINTVVSILFSYVIGFFMYILFEAPFTRLVNDFIKPKLSIKFEKTNAILPEKRNTGGRFSVGSVNARASVGFKNRESTTSTLSSVFTNKK